jgi:hypothetical protein
VVVLAAVVVVVGLGAQRLVGGGPVRVRDLTSRVDDRRKDLAPERSRGDRAAAAGALARDYATAAKGAQGAVRVRLRRVARAYERAADAARRDDGSDYDDALASAQSGERALDRRAGDEASDDASDDEGDEDDNGD